MHKIVIYLKILSLNKVCKSYQESSQKWAWDNPRWQSLHCFLVHSVGPSIREWPFCVWVGWSEGRPSAPLGATTHTWQAHRGKVWGRMWGAPVDKESRGRTGQSSASVCADVWTQGLIGSLHNECSVCDSVSPCVFTCVNTSLLFNFPHGSISWVEQGMGTVSIFKLLHEGDYNEPMSSPTSAKPPGNFHTGG